MATILLTNPETEFSIGQTLLRGGTVGKNYDWGIFWIKRAADGGNAEAQAMLGRNFLVGLPKQDLKEAIKYLEMGAKQNEHECTKLLAYAYTYGQGVPQNFDKSIELCKRSLENEREGRELMNLSFLSLILPEKWRDYKRSRECSEELMRLGYTSAWSYWSLGVIYEYGLGIEKDPVKSAAYYERGAQLGDNDCQFALARVVREGKGAKTDPALLRSYLENASRTQVLDAQIMLSLLLATETRDAAKENTYTDLLKRLDKRGFHRYVSRLSAVSPPGKPNNPTHSLQMFLDETFDTDGTKHLVAALMHRYGIGVKPDFQAFMQSLNFACEKELADATTLKGNVLTGMDLGSPNYKEAFALYKNAADKSQVYAEGQLGMLYALGLGVDQSWEQAITWLKKSADRDDPESLYMLAGFYCDGRGVAPDRNKSVALFERAAQQGHEDAMLELGIMCGSSEFPDLQQDSAKAERYFRQAASHGFQEANYYLGTMLASKGRTQAAFDCYKAAADRKHLLSQIQVGRYYMNRDEFDNAQIWFDKAIEQDSITAPRELKLLAVRKSMLVNNPEATSLVVSARKIEKGTVITEGMVKTIKKKLDEDDAQWQNDVLTRTEAVIGATAESELIEGSYITAGDIEFPDPRIVKK
jgi:TPR repeat protein